MPTLRLTKQFRFEGAHALTGYDGKCRHIHGHSYILFVTVKGTPSNPDGTPNTAHSLNPVQFIVIGAGDEVKTVKDGALCNVAPTILKLMGIPQPAAMTAEPLI